MGARERTGTSACQVSDAPGPVFKQALSCPLGVLVGLGLVLADPGDGTGPVTGLAAW
jgi:hypothetical protein